MKTQLPLYVKLGLYLLPLVPIELGSESLTLMTYYPSPLGVYNQLTTTGGTPAVPVHTVLVRDAGRVGIGTTQPNFRLRVGANDANWTSSSWNGAVELQNGAALGWQSNGAGKSFGIGHTNGGTYIFRSGSPPGSIASAAQYDANWDDGGFFFINNPSINVQSGIFPDGDIYMFAKKAVHISPKLVADEIVFPPTTCTPKTYATGIVSCPAGQYATWAKGINSTAWKLDFEYPGLGSLGAGTSIGKGTMFCCIQ